MPNQGYKRFVCMVGTFNRSELMLFTKNGGRFFRILHFPGIAVHNYFYTFKASKKPVTISVSLAVLQSK